MTSVWLFLKYWNSDLPTHRFILYYISVPVMVYSLTKTICTAFSIFALTQSTVRFLYVDVFYINIFRELVNTTYWTYLLVLIFSPYYFSLSTRVNLAFLAAIFVSLIVQSVLVITYTCSVYFRYETWLGSLWQLFVCQHGHCQQQESRKHIHHSCTIVRAYIGHCRGKWDGCTKQEHLVPVGLRCHGSLKVRIAENEISGT